MIDTKPNLSDNKFEQCVGDTLILSGCTEIRGTFRILSGATLSILPNHAYGKVLTSDASGNGTWQFGFSGATNGLSRCGQNVVLGGSLTGNTTIDILNRNLLICSTTRPNRGLFMCQTTDELCLSWADTGNTSQSINNFKPTGLTFTSQCPSSFCCSEIQLTYPNNRICFKSQNQYQTYHDACGLWYTQDFSGCGISDRWIPDKSYVDTKGGSGMVICQPSHGFNVNDVLGWSGGTYNKPIANGTYDGEIIGIVTRCFNSDCFLLTQAGFVCGLFALSANTTYFLSDTFPGLLTPIAPITDGYVDKPMLSMNDTTSGWVLPYPPVNVSTGTTGGGNFGWSDNTNGSTVAGCCTCPVGSSICDNTFYGACAGHNITSGQGNTAIGFNALRDITTGANNIALSCGALISNDTGCNNIAGGFAALANNTCGSDNIAFGSQALTANMCGVNNIALGFASQFANTIGINNIALGGYTLYQNDSGGDNVAIGYFSQRFNTCGNYNIGVGSNTLRCNSTGCDNVALGAFTLYSTTCGSDNVAIGFQTLYSNIEGSYNIGAGYQALYSNTCGVQNIGIGMFALENNTCGESNIGIGMCAAYNNGWGFNNIGIGTLALTTNYVGSGNTAIGLCAMSANYSGSDNIGIGCCALTNNYSGCHNIGIGYQTLHNASSATGNTAIGYKAGYLETVSDRLHIANNGTCSLIYGEFDNKIVAINGTLKISGVTDGVGGESALVWDAGTCEVRKSNGMLTSAANGLSKSGSYAVLGGRLTGNTCIDVSGSTFAVTGTSGGINQGICVGSSQVMIGDICGFKHYILNSVNQSVMYQQCPTGDFECAQVGVGTSGAGMSAGNPTNGDNSSIDLNSGHVCFNVSCGGTGCAHKLSVQSNLINMADNNGNRDFTFDCIISSYTSNYPNIVCSFMSPTYYRIDGTCAFAGIEYCSDFSCNYSNRSLVDKGWVLGQITGGTGSTALSTFTITGDSTATGFTINHAKNKQFVSVEVVRGSSPFDTIYTSVQRPNANCVCVTFDVAPTTGQEYKILIIS